MGGFRVIVYKYIFIFFTEEMMRAIIEKLGQLFYFSGGFNVTTRVITSQSTHSSCLMWHCGIDING